MLELSPSQACPIEQLTKGEQRQHYIAQSMQDALYFPRANEDIEQQLQGNLEGISGNHLLSEYHVLNGIRHMYLGCLSILSYSEVARRIQPLLATGQSLVPEHLPQIHYLFSNLPSQVPFRGAADAFSRTAMMWFGGAAAGCLQRQQAPEDTYQPLIQKFTFWDRKVVKYLADNPQVFHMLYGSSQLDPEKEADSIKIRSKKQHIRNASIPKDNVLISLGMLLQWGLSYTREEQRFPDAEELTATAFEHLREMGWAITVKRKVLGKILHGQPLAPTFHLYEHTELAGVDDFFPGHTTMFTQGKHGYTYRYKNLSQGPLSGVSVCPGLLSGRRPESEYQEAVEVLFDAVETKGGRTIPRAGDGSFIPAVAALAVGGFISRDTLYAAWPNMVS